MITTWERVPPGPTAALRFPEASPAYRRSGDCGGRNCGRLAVVGSALDSGGRRIRGMLIDSILAPRLQRPRWINKETVNFFRHAGGGWRWICHRRVS